MIDVEKFWSLATGGAGCWEWAAGKDGDGYGAFRVDGKTMKAHRVAWTLAHGGIPDGLLVCHKCDNRKCIRPDHLFLGTNDDNMADMKNKGRAPSGDRHGRRTHPERTARGERVPQSRLTKDKALEILAKHRDGAGVKPLGREYGITPKAVRDLVQRRTWRHIVEEAILSPMPARGEG